MLQLDGIQPGDGVKAERPLRLTGSLTGSMMELQTLQDALKVEIQVHQKLVAQMKQDPQNADLKKQLHELQAKITALSEKQKKVVEQLRKDLLVKQEPEVKAQVTTAEKHVLQIPSSTTLQALQQNTHGQALQQKTPIIPPVISTRTLPLVLKAATHTMPASVMAPCPTTVAMVTAISHASKPGGTNSDIISNSQNTPVNLQLASKASVQGSEPLRLMSKNAVVVQATTTTPTSAQPIKVPQFVPPPRLTPRPTYQPQVRPKPATVNSNVPIAPAPPPPMMAAPQLLQRGSVMLTSKLSASSLPSSAGPIHQVRIVNGQPSTATGPKSVQPTGTLTGIVITAPASVCLATPTQTLQLSGLASDTKTVKAHGGCGQKVVSSTPPLSPAPRTKRDDNPQKLAFMVSLGLVTHDHLEEIQSRRQERKRRTTANPVYSGAVFEPERKKSAVTYLNTPLHQGTRKRGRPPKYSSVPELGNHTPTSLFSCHTSSLAPERPNMGGSFPLLVHPHHTLPMPNPSSGDGDIHEDFCTVCRRSGQLLMCDTCSRVYHLDCLDPPLKTIPKGMWICPKCQDQILKKEDAIQWPGTLAIVHSYIAYKEAKEEEKQKLMKWSSELRLEREQLEQTVKQLSGSITKCMETKNTILSRQKEMQASLEKVKRLVRLIQAFNFGQTVEDESTGAITDTVRAKDANVPSEITVDVVNNKTVAELNSQSVTVLKAEVTPQDVAVRKDEVVVDVIAETVAGVCVEAALYDSPGPTAEINAVPVTDSSLEPATKDNKAEGLKETATEAVAAAVAGDSPAATTNGTSRHVCTVSSSAERCTNNKDESCAYNANANPENKVLAANSTEVKEQQEENTNRNRSNTDNSKTSEPSHHPLPALLNRLDSRE